MGSLGQAVNTLNSQPVGASGALGTRVYKAVAFVYIEAAAAQSTELKLSELKMSKLKMSQ